jgi:very-short-patch-repair endonuclease
MGRRKSYEVLARSNPGLAAAIAEALERENGQRSPSSTSAGSKSSSPSKRRRSASSFGKGSDLERQFQAQLLLAGAPPFHTHYRFHPTRHWEVDVVWLEPRKLAVEVEGGTWVGGRHVRPEGFKRDCQKYAEAALLGFTVLRFTTEQIKNGEALEYVLRFLEGAGVPA